MTPGRKGTNVGLPDTILDAVKFEFQTNNKELL